MPEEDITQCCMNCERLAGELEDVKSLIREAVGIISSVQGRAIIIKDAEEFTRRPEVKAIMEGG